MHPTGPTPKLALCTGRGADWVVISLHNSGPGIEPQVFARIFEPFFATKPVGNGTGLGLSIGYGIVKRHGGTLTADNHPQGGAEFVLRLPALAQCACGLPDRLAAAPKNIWQIGLYTI